MNRRDQELLDKQLHAIYPPPRHDGVIMLGIVTVFFAGHGARRFSRCLHVRAGADRDGGQHPDNFDSVRDTCHPRLDRTRLIPPAR